MKIYTKTGDKGETGLYGGKRIKKSSALINAIGEVDELNALLGVVISELKDLQAIQDLLLAIQNDLFVIGSDLASPSDLNTKLKDVRISTSRTAMLESKIDYYQTKLPQLTNFILPGGSKPGALLHFARSVCRRAERSVIYAQAESELHTEIQVYLNRLSDLLFVLARFVNKHAKTEETVWKT